jgi:hypothetical protein
MWYHSIECNTYLSISEALHVDFGIEVAIDGINDENSCRN